MIFFLLPEIRYGIGLVEQSPEKMCIVTSHRHQAVDMLRDRGEEIICLEDWGIEPVYQAHHMLELSLVREKILATPPAERTILTFKITPKLEKLAQELQATVLMPPYQLNRFWEDKNKGMKELSSIHVPIKPSSSGAFLSLEYDALAALWNHSKLVVQKPRGMAGSTTYFVDSKAQWDDLRQIVNNTLVKVTPYIEGEPFTINCLLNNTGVYHGYPMFQITGDKRFTRYSGGTCGVDMSGTRVFDQSFLHNLAMIVRKIGEALQKTQFWGWFGIDFLVTDQNEIVVIEINPRFTASISLFSQAQYHILGSSFWQGYLDKGKIFPDMVKPLPFTTLLLRNTDDETITIKNNLTCGIYAPHADTYQLKQSTIFISDLCSLANSNTRFSQHTDLPLYLLVAKSSGTKIHTDGEIATIVALRSATDKNGNIDADLGKIANFVTMVLNT